MSSGHLQQLGLLCICLLVYYKSQFVNIPARMSKGMPTRSHFWLRSSKKLPVGEKVSFFKLRPLEAA